MRKKLTKFVPVQSSYQMLLRNIVLRFVDVLTTVRVFPFVVFYNKIT